MKRVNYVLAILLVLGFILETEITSVKWIPQIIRKSIFFGYLIGLVIYALLFKKILSNKIDRFSKTLNGKIWKHYSPFVFPGMYLFDVTNANIYGVFMLNPFKIQKLDAREVDDVEIIVRELAGITYTILCRVWLGKKKHDIYVLAASKYNKATVGGERDLFYRKRATEIKEMILKMRLLAKQLRKD